MSAMAAAFDLIVVGGGTAGSVVAARCAGAGRRVLLLEAGPAPEPGDRPAALAGPSFHAALAVPGRAWRLEVARTAGGPPVPYLCGRGLGGGSSVNAMLADHADGLPIELHAAAPGERGALSRALLDAAPGAGLDVEPALLTRDAQGHRHSVVEAYVDPAVRDDGLVVSGDTLVDRVLLDRHGMVIGVRVADGREFGAPCVVIAAGALHSPGILLRSGIDRPGVGSGLQDHPSITLPVQLRKGEPSTVVPVSVVCRGTARVAGDIRMMPVDQTDPTDARRAGLLAAVMHVESRGAVRLVDDDPHTPPRVEFASLSHPDDVAALRTAIDLARRFADTEAFEAVGELCDVDVSVEALRAAVGGIYHPTSTCRMGRPDDPLAVVDAECRVIGAEGLFVCDASVFPRVPMANPNLPVIRLAERVAAIVRATTTDTARE